MTKENQLHSRKYQVRQRLKPTIAPLTAAIGGALAAGSLQAATITVDTLDDGIPSEQCSLRGALYAATTNSSSYGGGCPAGDSGQDTIVFASGLSGTINLDFASGIYYDGTTLPIGESVIIDGEGRITIQGSGAAPAMYQKYQVDGFHAEEVELRGLTITGGGGDYGGAIRSHGLELALSNCTLTGNSATEGGGAIWHSSPADGSSWLTIAASEISGNEVTANGGRGGAIAVDRSSHSLVITSTTLNDNESQGSGGAIDWRASNGTVGFYNNSSFSNNTAKYGDGGAVNIVSQGAYGASVFFRDTDFYGNLATGYGGGAAVSDSGSGVNGFGQFRLRGSNFEQNTAGESGGGLWLSRGDGSGTAGTPENYVDFETNSFNGRPTAFIGNTAAYSGGGAEIIVGDATPVNFIGVDFTGNSANDGNGGGALITTGNAGLSMSQVTVAGNTAQGSGQGAGFRIAANNGGDVEGRQVDVNDNYGNYGGGMRIIASGGDVLFEDARFVDNTADQSFGGGLQVSGTLNQFGIGSSIFSGNIAGQGGAGLDLYSPYSENILAEVKYSEWSGNEAGNSGGAINLELGAGSQLFLENSTLSGNTSGNNGAALNTYGDQQLTVKYSTVANNIATNEGGGIFNSQTGDCNVYNSLFDGNTGAAGAEEQDLRATTTDCGVQNSLLSGADSQFTDDGGNILYQDPMLLPLADNGGANGRTHALADSSPAVDAGSAGSYVPDSDQRGSPFQRVFGSALDMGAYELQTLEDAIFSDRFEAP
ncbi:choice-of-anchor Q domain-containing protein [Wenzhouxiangella sediminis]|nr:choice-of-anchor Q domain-containing protein [Wenzhouxiangella sediminis]